MIIVNMFEFSEKVGFESPSRTGALTEGGRVRIILDFLNDDAKKIAFQSIRGIYIPPPIHTNILVYLPGFWLNLNNIERLEYSDG